MTIAQGVLAIAGLNLAMLTLIVGFCKYYIDANIPIASVGLGVNPVVQAPAKQATG
jgi:hypothetical protein